MRDVRASATLPSTVSRTPFLETVDDGVDKVCASAVLSVDMWWTRLGIDVALLVVAEVDVGKRCPPGV